VPGQCFPWPVLPAGSRTFQGNGIDTERLLQENSDKFAHKWGLPDVGQRVIVRPWAQGGNGPQMTQMNADKGTKDQETSGRNGRRNEPTSRPGLFHLRSSASSADKNSEVSVSLTLIVRDEEENLLACLASVAGLFDEIVVVDTGSTDRTAAIAREFGARVFDFVWVNDFATARNAALDRAMGDYARSDNETTLETRHGGLFCAQSWSRIDSIQQS
jgi:Glycosyl transferase family 2